MSENVEFDVLKEESTFCVKDKEERFGARQGGQ